MSNAQYAVLPYAVGNLLSMIETKQIAIPEIQRPFVWNSTKVRNLLDSLFCGYPVGYLIMWQNPDVKLKDGTTAFGKRILIDGQQRVTALMAALLGVEVVNKDYKKARIKLAFHPQECRFEVWNSAIAKDPSWIPDIAPLFTTSIDLFALVNDYCARNPGTTQNEVFKSISALKAITGNPIGVIELNHQLDIETVTEIFIRVNSAGVALGQADFAMSKIAVDEKHDGNVLRKAIDYFCHLSVAPEVYTTIKNDKEFATSGFFQKMEWLKNDNDDLYDPSYTDMLRVAFTTEFKRGRLEDLVALLSGRNFETKQFEEAIIEESFTRLQSSVLNFMNEYNYKNFLLIIKSAGYIDSSMIGSQNALNFGYVLYLTLRAAGMPPADIQRHVARWFVMSVLTGRYSGSTESVFDSDIRQIHAMGIAPYLSAVIEGELSAAFWETTLPLAMDTSVVASPYFRVFEAAQVKLGDRGFLSNAYTVGSLISVKSDVHHIFPSDLLKKQGMGRAQYNQIANFAVTQSEINIAIGNKEPRIYFEQLRQQCAGGPKVYGNITDPEVLRDNLRTNCIPEDIGEMGIADYPAFLAERRRLMAQRIRTYFQTL